MIWYANICRKHLIDKILQVTFVQMPIKHMVFQHISKRFFLDELVTKIGGKPPGPGKLLIFHPAQDLWPKEDQKKGAAEEIKDVAKALQMAVPLAIKHTLHENIGSEGK